ncbi:MAG: hypothetical protein PHX69_14405 [Simplicispira sp.]|uniref:hypothetical protein n=1 Tax=Simplicispira sp. TaxID=2015802 RepID=UPI00258AEEAD|nr:hypothetical protein [Simplicispira sp.]MDD2692956.1 hypothetical protein [Simplicispira sp.]
MTQRRRFFPSTPVQTVPGRTVEMEVQVRRTAPIPATSVVEPLVVKPPVWCGWEDDDGIRMVDLSVNTNSINDDAGATFEQGLFVAVVDGAQYVHWDISFTPVLWSVTEDAGQQSQEEVWRGDVIETTLSSDEFWSGGYAELIELPADIGGAEPDAYWPMESMWFRKDGEEWTGNGVYLPIYIAAGNTLSVSLFHPAATISGELTAVAKTIEDVEIGRVTLRLIVPCEF